MAGEGLLEGFRTRRARLHATAVESSWLLKLGAAAGFAGLTALLAQLSVPLPWTPVPFTFQVLGVLLSGVMLGPRYGVAAMLLYLGAGIAGLQVFAPSGGGAEGWRVLVPDAVARTGFTAGYLVGFPVAAWFVGAYIKRRAAGEGARLVRAAAWLLTLLLVAVAGGFFFLAGGGTLKDGDSGAAYQSGADAAWLFAGAFLVLAPLLAWLLRRRGSPSLELFVVLLGATAIVHALGVLVLAPTLGLTWTRAAALGSAVFLPFDALKAALAVLLAPAFLPSPSAPSRGDSP